MIQQWRKWSSLALLLSGLWHAPLVWAELLSVELTGVEDDLRKNVLAWLGNAPETPQSRSNYLHSARSKVEQSLKALGYYRAEIDMDLNRQVTPWSLHISVQPGEPVRLRNIDIKMVGEGSTDSALTDLVASTTLRPGTVLNHSDYERTRRGIATLAQQRGYFDGVFEAARVEVEPVGGTADVVLHFASGPRYAFGQLLYDQDIIRQELLQPLIKVQEGEPYEQRKLSETQAQLQRTGYFSTVILRPDLGRAENGQVPMDMTLYPAKRHSFDLGIGFSTDTRERLSVTWRTPKLNRLGHSQETRLQYSSINPSGHFTYQVPLSHPLNDVLQFWARLEDNEFGDLDSNQKELGIRRELRSGPWVYSYSLRGLDEAWDAQGLDQESDYLLPGLSFSQRQRKGSLVNPSSGFSQWYQVEAAHGDFGSDVDLLRLSARFGYIQSLGAKHRLVLGSDLGAAFVSDSDRDQLAPSLNFFAGGSQTIRGYSYQSIGNEVTVTGDSGDPVRLVVGGERLVTASVEYQYSVTDSWRGAVFVDAGDAFDEGEFNLNVGAGVGLHYVTQVGAIRVELANPVNDDNPSWRLHVAIGAEF